MNSRKIAIGDIHGCINTFSKLLDSIHLQKQDVLYLLGDYIDRGSDSKSVIDLIIKLQKNGYKVKPLIGNHEFMFLESHNFYKSYLHWITQGGNVTIDSFEEYFDVKYLDFFKELKYFYIEEEYILVHGGLDFTKPKPLEHPDSIIWTRNKTIDKTKTGGRKLIVGHTPTELSKIQKSVNEDIVHLDGGCVYADVQWLGNLIALDFTNMNLFTQKNIEIQDGK